MACNTVAAAVRAHRGEVWERLFPGHGAGHLLVDFSAALL